LGANRIAVIGGMGPSAPELTAPPVRKTAHSKRGITRRKQLRLRVFTAVKFKVEVI
jgi:hypothetical protein